MSAPIMSGIASTLALAAILVACHYWRVWLERRNGKTIDLLRRSGL